MTNRIWSRRLGSFVGAIVLLAMLGGCSNSNKVAFTNVTDSWLNVRFFIQDANPTSETVTAANFETTGNDAPWTNPFVSDKKSQIKPGETVTLKPGGYHIMLMGLKDQLKQGDTFKTALEFAKAGKVDVEFKIEGIAATGANASGHGGMKH